MKIKRKQLFQNTPYATGILFMKYEITETLFVLTVNEMSSI